LRMIYIFTHNQPFLCRFWDQTLEEDEGAQDVYQFVHIFI
jgi:hypothetical protein